jgi:hypothetical protein
MEWKKSSVYLNCCTNDARRRRTTDTACFSVKTPLNSQSWEIPYLTVIHFPEHKVLLVHFRAPSRHSVPPAAQLSRHTRNGKNKRALSSQHCWRGITSPRGVTAAVYGPHTTLHGAWSTITFLYNEAWVDKTYRAHREINGRVLC